MLSIADASEHEHAAISCVNEITDDGMAATTRSEMIRILAGAVPV